MAQRLCQVAQHAIRELPQLAVLQSHPLHRPATTGVARKEIVTEVQCHITLMYPSCKHRNTLLLPDECRPQIKLWDLKS